MGFSSSRNLIWILFLHTDWFIENCQLLHDCSDPEFFFNWQQRSAFIIHTFKEKSLTISLGQTTHWDYWKSHCWNIMHCKSIARLGFKAKLMVKPTRYICYDATFPPKERKIAWWWLCTRLVDAIHSEKLWMCCNGYL